MSRQQWTPREIVDMLDELTTPFAVVSAVHYGAGFFGRRTQTRQQVTVGQSASVYTDQPCRYYDTKPCQARSKIADVTSRLTSFLSPRLSH